MSTRKMKKIFLEIKGYLEKSFWNKWVNEWVNKWRYQVEDFRRSSSISAFESNNSSKNKQNANASSQQQQFPQPIFIAQKLWRCPGSGMDVRKPTELWPARGQWSDYSSYGGSKRPKNLLSEGICLGKSPRSLVTGKYYIRNASRNFPYNQTET